MRLTPRFCFIILIHSRIKAAGIIVEGFDSQTVVTRYGSRYWAVYLNGELLAVTVYKKGALAVQQALGSTLPVMVEQSKVSSAVHLREAEIRERHAGKGSVENLD